MAIVANTNVSSLIAQYQLTVNTQTLQKSYAQLSSGLRINSAADDPAGITISENLTSEIKRMQQDSQNTQSGINMLQIADGGLQTISDNLQRIRELAVEAGNDTNSTASRNDINTEIQALMNEIDQVSSSTNMNGINLLDGSVTTAPIQVGPNSTPGVNSVDIASGLTNASSSGLGITGVGKTFSSTANVDLSSNALADSFINDIDGSIQALGTQQAAVGAFENELQSTSSNLGQSVVNLSAANSTIEDTNIAAETSIMTQAQIMTQADTSILAQTNNLPQMILNLLQNSHA